MNTNKYGHTEVITDLHIKLCGKSHQDFLEVKANGGVDSCKLPLRAHRGMFPNNLTTGGLPKPDVLQLPAGCTVVDTSHGKGILKQAKSLLTSALRSVLASLPHSPGVYIRTSVIVKV